MNDPHVDVAACVLGMLEAPEREQFEAHLEGCERCRGELDELRAVRRAMAPGRAAPAPVAPAHLEDAVLAAVGRAARADEGGPGEPVTVESPALDAAAAGAAPAAGSRRALPRGAVLLLAALLLAGAGFVLGSQMQDEKLVTQTVPGPERTVRVEATPEPPEPEVVADLANPNGAGEPLLATATIARSLSGRVITLESTDLPELRAGQHYELWWVGPDDAPQAPRRISAGTFEPDVDGRVDIALSSAINPREYPTLAVTREATDGNPLPTPPDVVTGEVHRP